MILYSKSHFDEMLKRDFSLYKMNFSASVINYIKQLKRKKKKKLSTRMALSVFTWR